VQPTRSAEIAAGERLLQFLQGAILRFRKELRQEGDREQSEDDEDQEGALDFDGRYEDGEDERDDRVGYPQTQDAHAHSQAANVRREDLRDDDPHRDVQGQLHAEDEEHHKGEDNERLGEAVRQQP
jgi:hypothetical protein